MNILIDAFGGDNAPLEVIRGGAQAVQELGVTVTLVGDEQKIRDCAEENGLPLDGMEILHAPAVFDIHEEPTSLLKQHADTSMAVGMQALHDGKGDAFVCAGSTGALLVGATFLVKRIPGIKRAAVAPVLPTETTPFLLIDGGANVDCKPEYLTQFGVMGDAYMRGVMGIEKPRVGIINIGAEDEKGNALVKDAFPMMAEAPYHFVGSVEARDLFSDIADVCVADGFAGNLVLKTMEGVAMFMLKTMKQELMADTRSKMGAALAKPALRRLKHTLDYTEVGGAPLLGVQGAVVKAHGSSNAHAFSCAIDQAIKMVNGHVVEIIEKGVAKMNSQDAQ